MVLEDAGAAARLEELEAALAAAEARADESGAAARWGGAGRRDSREGKGGK